MPPTADVDPLAIVCELALTPRGGDVSGLIENK